MRPEEPELKNRCDQLNHMLHDLKVECLSFGTAVHAIKDVGINQKTPYNFESERAKMRGMYSYASYVKR